MTEISDDSPQIIIACDHAGFEQKENIVTYLETNYPHFSIKDLTPKLILDDDYPDVIFDIKQTYDKMENKEHIKVIAVCGTGNGMCIGLNRYTEFRAINGYSLKHVKLGRQHNDANCLCMGGPLIIEKKALELLKIFLFTKFSHVQRHQKRIDKLSDKNIFCN